VRLLHFFCLKYYPQTLGPPERKPLRLGHVLKSLFLPTGYPASVRQDYIHFQKWEVAKGIVSSAGFVYTPAHPPAPCCAICVNAIHDSAGSPQTLC
jgi:hypothetical protein